MDAKAIKKLLDPTAYTGLCAEMARDSAYRGRAAVVLLSEAMLQRQPRSASTSPDGLQPPLWQAPAPGP